MNRWSPSPSCTIKIVNCLCKRHQQYQWNLQREFKEPMDPPGSGPHLKKDQQSLGNPLNKTCVITFIWHKILVSYTIWKRLDLPRSKGTIWSSGCFAFTLDRAEQDPEPLSRDTRQCQGLNWEKAQNVKLWRPPLPKSGIITTQNKVKITITKNENNN